MGDIEFLTIGTKETIDPVITGIPTIDAPSILRKGDSIAIVSPPGIGKTALAIHIATRIGWTLYIDASDFNDSRILSGMAQEAKACNHIYIYPISGSKNITDMKKADIPIIPAAVIVDCHDLIQDLTPIEINNHIWSLFPKATIITTMGIASGINSQDFITYKRNMSASATIQLYRYTFTSGTSSYLKGHIKGPSSKTPDVGAYKIYIAHGDGHIDIPRTLWVSGIKASVFSYREGRALIALPSAENIKPLRTIRDVYEEFLHNDQLMEELEEAILKTGKII